MYCQSQAFLGGQKHPMRDVKSHEEQLRALGLLWRTGRSGETLLFSTTTRKEVVVGGRVGLLSHITVIGTDIMASSCDRVGSGWIFIFSETEIKYGSRLPRKVVVTFPEGIQETCRCCTQGHGLVGTVGMDWWLDQMISVAFYNLSDCVIIWFYTLAKEDSSSFIMFQSLT